MQTDTISTQTIQTDILLKGEQVARILYVSRSYAFLLMQRGEIPTVRLGRAVRVRPGDLERYIITNLSQKVV